MGLPLLNDETDGSPFLPIDRDLLEARDRDQVDTVRSDETTGDSDRLHRLVYRPRSDCLDLRSPTLP